MTLHHRTAFQRGVSSFVSGLRELADDRYDAFQQTYFTDPVGFALDCIEWPDGESLTAYQSETMQGLLVKKRIAVRSLHGAGKTTTAALIILWYALTRDGRDWKIVTTASKWRQLIEYLWPEIHKWGRRLKWDTIGRPPFSPDELQTLHIVLRTGRAAAVASNVPSAIEGAHADYMLYVFDEAKAIPDPIWDAAEGAFSGGPKEALALAISTPGEALGQFFDIHKGKDGYEEWFRVHWTLDMAMAAGRTTEEWVAAKRAKWGETDPRFLNRVLGEFAENDPRGVIPLAWVELANERWRDWMENGGPADGKCILTAIGVDVGSGSPEGDRSVIAPAFDGVKIAAVDYVPQGDPDMATLDTADQTAIWLNPRKSAEAIVDVIGIGAGVMAYLRRIGYRARGFWASKDTAYKDASGETGFVNWRSCGWWLLREMLSPSSGYNICLPPDEDLTTDLIALRWTHTNDDRQLIRVEPKENIRRRIGRSTDAGDAVMMAIIGPILCDEEDLGGQSRLVYDPPNIGGW